MFVTYVMCVPRVSAPFLFVKTLCLRLFLFIHCYLQFFWLIMAIFSCFFFFATCGRTFKYYFAIVDYRLWMLRYFVLYSVTFRNERLVLYLNVHTGEHTQIYKVPFQGYHTRRIDREMKFLINIPIYIYECHRWISRFIVRRMCCIWQQKSRPNKNIIYTIHPGTRNCYKSIVSDYAIRELKWN